MMYAEDPNFELIQESFYAEFGDSVGPKGSGWKQFKRWEYYWQNRLDENGNMPDPSTRLQAFVHFQSLQQGLGKYALGTGSWAELGPVSLPQNGTGQPNGLGRISSLAFHPTDPNTLYAGAASGGFWVSNDNGTTWSKSISGLLRLGVSSIVVHPTTPNVIYIGTGDRDGGDVGGYGVWKSTDGGATWATSNTGMGNQTVNELLMDPTNSNRLIASTSNNRIYRSTNGGATWSFTGITTNAKDIAFKPGDPNTIYAAGTTFSVSTDGGVTFTQINAGLVAASRYAIGVSANQPNYVYLIGGNGGGLTGIYRSTNSGTSFTTQTTTPNLLGYGTTGGTGSQAWYDLVMAADPTNANTLFIGGVNIWKSIDGGVNWTLSGHWTGSGGADDVHADQHVLAYSPFNNNIYNGNDGGVYYSTDAGIVWNDISSGLGISQVYKIGVSQSTEYEVINGYQDNGTAIYNSGTWSTEIGGDGMGCIIDPVDANYMYGALYYGDIRRSTNGGATFGSISGPVTETGAWVTPYILDPNNENTMYAGYENVWRSTNVKAGTPTWTSLSAFSGTSKMTALAVAPSNSDVLYASRTLNGERFWRSNNATAGTPTWTNLSANLPVNTTPKDIAVDPTNPNHVFVAITNDIYESTDGGLSWTNYAGTLPNISLNTIAIDHDSPIAAMYVGMDVGVYYRDNTMADWTLYSTGIPNVEITELEIYRNTAECKSKLYAATYGQGLWVSDLKDPGNVAPIACFETQTTNICAASTVVFTDLSDYTPTSWTWSISPATYAFVNATNANSQFPEVQFTATGTYQISLTATNANGFDVESKPGYITVSPASIATALNDDFEAYALCGTASDCGTTLCNLAGSLWTNLTNGTDDNVDWRLDEGGTPSAGTGPSVDFNPGTAAGNYAYIEASSCSANTAILESECILLDVDYNFELGYHMLGTNMGALYLDIFTGGAWVQGINSISGDQGASWQVMVTDMSAWTGQAIRLRIRGVTGNGFASDLAIDDLAFTPITVLPLTLVDFTATLVDERSVRLDWGTSSEVNAASYTVQRSQDLSTWEDVTEVSAAGFSNGPLSYEAWDHQPFQGVSYYRLKLLDFDGQFSYSEYRSISRGANHAVSAYPNPVTDGLLIVEGNAIESCKFSVLSSLGQSIITHSYKLDANRMAFEVAHFTSGVYFIEIRQEGLEPQRIKFVVQ